MFVIGFSGEALIIWNINFQNQQKARYDKL